MKMRSSKKWLTGILGAVLCLTLAVTVKQNVSAEEETNRASYIVCKENTKLYVAADWTGEIAASVPKDGVLIRIGEEGFYTKATYKGIEGYIDSQLVGYNEEAIAAYEEELAREAEKIAAELEAQRLALELIAKSEEVRMMAAMIQCEAGNQPIEGQIAVGAVIMNRVKAANYPNTIPEVLSQPHQFNPVDSQMFADLLANDTIKDSCREAAVQAFMGVDNVGGAMHFRRAGSREGIVIGNHVFF